MSPCPLLKMVKLGTLDEHIMVRAKHILFIVDSDWLIIFAGQSFPFIIVFKEKGKTMFVKK